MSTFVSLLLTMFGTAVGVTVSTLICIPIINHTKLGKLSREVAEVQGRMDAFEMIAGAFNEQIVATLAMLTDCAQMADDPRIRPPYGQEHHR